MADCKALKQFNKTDVLMNHMVNITTGYFRHLAGVHSTVGCITSNISHLKVFRGVRCTKTRYNYSFVRMLDDR